MDRESATRITKDYFKAWIEQDKSLFLSLLDPNVVINECTGDTYIDKTVAEKWFEGWHAGGNHVISWDINSQYFDEVNEVASATWTFLCLYRSIKYTFDGVTIIRFKDNRIIGLDEYQMEVDKKYPYTE